MRLIDADALLEDIGEEPMNWTNSPEEIQEHSDWKQTVAIINSALTIEAEPVRHGHWVIKKRHEHYPSGKEYEEDFCSACNMRGSIEYDYCPHCGAKMNEAFEWLD